MGSVALIAAFCFVPVTLLAQNVSESAGIQNLSDGASLSASNNEYYGPPAGIYVSSDSDVCITFEFLGLNPATSFASFGIVVGSTGSGAATIRNMQRYAPLLVISSNAGLSSIAIPIPSSALTGKYNRSCSPRPQGYVREVGFRARQDIFVLGQPRAFPNDWYELDDTVTLYMCPPGGAQDQCATGSSQQGTAQLPPVPLKESLLATTRDQDMEMGVSTEKYLEPGQKELRFNFVLRRQGWFIAYTYFIAVMPFVLMIGLFGAYAFRRKNYTPERKVPAVYEIAFGVAAALVAILPLRAVLIPSSLPSLTRLDVVFGIGTALLVALSLAWVFIWTGQETSDVPQ